jgi:hypothetical protein
LIDIANADFGSFFDKPFGGRRSNTTATPGYQGDFTFQTHVAASFDLKRGV